MKRWEGSRITDFVGNTPIVQLTRVATDVVPQIFAKIEYFNPGGSIKDRPALYMCQQAAKQGLLKPGASIVECTSGNTGVGIALYAATHGHPCIFVMTKKQSKEKVMLLKAMGADVVLCPPDAAPGDKSHYQAVAQSLARELGAFFFNQYDNPSNPMAHYLSTGPEIFEQTGGRIGALVAGVGTGGTLSGTARYLKDQGCTAAIIGVDAEGSVFSQQGVAAEKRIKKAYHIEGIGDWHIPSNIDYSVIDQFEVVSDIDAFKMTRRLLSEEGLFVGGSSGAAVVAALRYAAQNPSIPNILVLLPDTGARYMTRAFNDTWLEGIGIQHQKSHNILDVNLLKTLSSVDVELA